MTASKVGGGVSKLLPQGGSRETRKVSFRHKLWITSSSTTYSEVRASNQTYSPFLSTRATRPPASAQSPIVRPWTVPPQGSASPNLTLISRMSLDRPSSDSAPPPSGRPKLGFPRVIVDTFIRIRGTHSLASVQSDTNTLASITMADRISGASHPRLHRTTVSKLVATTSDCANEMPDDSEQMMPW